MTQREVADKLGRSASYICRIERGNRKISSVRLSPVLRQLAGIYEVSPQQLLAEVGTPEFDLIKTMALAEPATDPLKDIKDVTEEERQELRRYLAFLRFRRATATL